MPTHQNLVKNVKTKFREWLKQIKLWSSLVEIHGNYSHARRTEWAKNS